MKFKLEEKTHRNHMSVIKSKTMTNLRKARGDRLSTIKTVYNIGQQFLPQKHYNYIKKI